MNIYEKLMKARLTLQGMKLTKTGHNKFAGYYYFELGDFLPQIQQIFADLKLCGIVSYGKEEAGLTITDMEACGENDYFVVIKSPMSSAALKGCHEVQNLGAVETYIRRYLWVTALEIVEHDALDATVGAEKVKAIKPSSGVEERIAPERREALERIYGSIVDCLNADMPIEAVKTASAITDPDEQVFVWDKLDSKQRSLIKRTKQEMALQEKK